MKPPRKKAAKTCKGVSLWAPRHVRGEIKRAATPAATHWHIINQAKSRSVCRMMFWCCCRKSSLVRELVVSFSSGAGDSCPSIFESVCHGNALIQEGAAENRSFRSGGGVPADRGQDGLRSETVPGVPPAGGDPTPKEQASFRIVQNYKA